MILYFVAVTLMAAAAFVAVLVVGQLRLEDTGRHCGDADPTPPQDPEQPRVDVAARFREDWERVRQEGLPLPPLRDCCLATVDEPHTGGCEAVPPPYSPRHDVTAMPRRKPIAGRQPWQTAQNPALRDQPVVPGFYRDGAPVFGQASVATVLEAERRYPCCVHCGDELDHLIHTMPCIDGCNDAAGIDADEAERLKGLMIP